MLRFLLWSMAKIPLSIARPLGDIWGSVLWLAQTKMAKITLKNIQLCFPEMSPIEQSSLAQKSLRETAKLTLEIASVWEKPPEWSLAQFISEKDKDILLVALEKPEPTIILVPHLGNWEAFGPYLAHIKNITILYLPPKNESHDQYIIQGREKAGIQLAPANRKGVLSLLKAAKNGEFIGILPDQEPDLDGGEFAPFFNNPALTMTLVHKLIQKNNCQIVMGYAKRINGGFEAVFRNPDNDIYSDDTSTSLSGLNRSIEQCVRDIPEQYQWEYKRFKQHPSGKKKVHYKGI